MRKAYPTILFLLLAFIGVNAETTLEIGGQDTAQVKQLLAQGFKSRLTDHEQTLKKAQQALDMAEKLNYLNGIGESYRVLGIGEYYANNEAKSFSDYLYALYYFKMSKNVIGQANVYNNIGNLYQTSDYDMSLEYLQKGLEIAQTINNTELLAKAYLNIGNVYNRKKNFSLAVDYYTKAQELFTKQNDAVNLIVCLQDFGKVYYSLKQYDKAEQFLLQANSKAKEKDLNTSIGGIDLTLTSLYVENKNYDAAQKFLDEGIAYAQITKDEKLEADFTYTQYQIELHKKNYAQALDFLHKVYVRDSAILKNNVTAGLDLLREQHDQQEKQKESELIIERQKNDRVKFWWAVSASGLMLVVIALLVGNVKRKARTNSRLTELNSEVSRQKDNLDRINHHLEEIIDERTRDLQVKNKKLSEYSSYLSHQIRGPIATLKGLMNLEKEGLVDQQECISMMNKCVSDIDEKIIDMTDILHDPKRTSFN
ncbi:MAG: tetratricopeptide repeat protein [Bacteroidetes bacterium]|nr:tetratricopeptide repeat protein [Bacteroidota bacterium]